MPQIDTNNTEILHSEKNIFQNTKIKMPKAKPLISIRLDSDVLDWFKSHGAGYQTRINAVLRIYMEAQKR